MLNFNMGNNRMNRSVVYTPQDTSALLPFYLGAFGEFISDNRYFTEREGFRSFLLIITISGTGKIRYAEKELLLTSGQAVIMDCSNYQYYGTSGTENWHFFWIHFLGTGADAMVQLINRDSIRVMEFEAHRAAELFDQMSEMIRTPGRQTDLIISLWIHQLLNDLVMTAEGGAAIRYQKDMLRTAEYLQKNLAEPVRVSELAKLCGMSEFHFVRTFKSVLGQPPYEYLTFLRMIRAKQLLAFSDLSVGEIAAQVGYSDTRGLIDNFRHRFKMTPFCYRKKAQKHENMP